MKIAILSPVYPYRGGIAQFSAMLYKALEKNHEIEVFSFNRLYPDFLFPGKTQLIEADDEALPIPSHRILDSIDPVSYYKTVKAIRKFEPDLLIISYWMSFFAPAYTYIARRLKYDVKILALLHNAIPHEPMFFDKPLAKRFFKQCNRFLVMSEVVKNDLLALKPDARYCLAEHPVYNQFGKKLLPEKAKSRYGLDTQKKTLLFFGLIRDYKGLDLLIDAMALLDDSYQLLVAGEAYGSFEKYKKQIDNNSAKDRIIVLNRYIGDHEVAVLFSASDVLVLPYKSATQSGVIPVAYHFENPVVTTDVGGLKASIEKAETGIVCRPEANDLARGVELIFSVGKERFIENIRREKENLSWDKFAGILLDLMADK
ncbi:MAG: glycosyltransferase [Dysgonamonadaceae bacterium]|jgi:glycosyltransferase involved in cell wall biosynthesis|nr:glycosyltransferase [Dysgonamonadaceae bacterium]